MLHDAQLDRQEKARDDLRVNCERAERFRRTERAVEAAPTEYEQWKYKRMQLQATSESLGAASRRATYNHVMALEALRQHEKREPKHEVGGQLKYIPCGHAAEAEKVRKSRVWGAGEDYGNNQPQPVRNSSSGSNDLV